MVRLGAVLPSTNRAIAKATLKRQLQRFNSQQEAVDRYDRAIGEHPKEGRTEQA